MSDAVLCRYPAVAGQPLKMALLCKPLLKLGRHDDAFAIGRAALATAPDDTIVRDLVRRALSADIPRFHRAMLHDAPRNACYAAAIARLVTPGMRVLEIGTGSGLLALLAAQAGATVVTCESNPLIAAAAREVIAQNGFADRIRVVTKLSTALDVEDDLGGPCDALISEVFGADLFDEGVVRSINDARARLLRPGAAILPPRAALRCALVRYEPSERSSVGEILGFDLSSFNLLINPYLGLPRHPDDQARLCSAAVSALRTDFTRDVAAMLRERVSLLAQGGRADGVVHWLQLDFGDGVVYENAPFVSQFAHWGTRVHLFAAPIDTIDRQHVDIDVKLFGTRLVFGLAA